MLLNKQYVAMDHEYPFSTLIHQHKEAMIAWPHIRVAICHLIFVGHLWAKRNQCFRLAKFFLMNIRCNLCNDDYCAVWTMCDCLPIDQTMVSSRRFSAQRVLANLRVCVCPCDNRLDNQSIAVRVKKIYRVRVCVMAKMRMRFVCACALLHECAKRSSMVVVCSASTTIYNCMPWVANATCTQWKYIIVNVSVWEWVYVSNFYGTRMQWQ